MKFSYTPNDFFTSVEVPVRFRDLDPLRHVNNAVFNTYFEEARIQFIMSVPELKRGMDGHYSFVLAHLDLSYIKPILYKEKIRVYSSIESTGNSSVSAIQAIFSEGEDELKAVAKTTGVWFDLNTNRPAHLPEITNIDQYILNEQNG